jgi:hypothetical protein
MDVQHPTLNVQRSMGCSPSGDAHFTCDFSRSQSLFRPVRTSFNAQSKMPPSSIGRWTLGVER